MTYHDHRAPIQQDLILFTTSVAFYESRLQEALYKIKSYLLRYYYDCVTTKCVWDYKERGNSTYILVVTFLLVNFRMIFKIL